MFMDPNNPQWGWSWLEHWMAARPWESRSVADNELAPVKSMSIGGQISKSYARQDSISDRMSYAPRKSSRPPSRQSPSEDDSRSMFSLQSEKYRRHSVGGSSVRDNDSLASTLALPSYMAPTQSAKAKSRFQAPSVDEIETPD